jgi:hypothetical protein
MAHLASEPGDEILKLDLDRWLVLQLRRSHPMPG